MTKLKQVSAYLTEKEKQKLVEAAQNEGRSISSLLSVIIRDYLQSIKNKKG